MVKVFLAVLSNKRETFAHGQYPDALEFKDASRSLVRPLSGSPSRILMRDSPQKFRILSASFTCS